MTTGTETPKTYDSTLWTGDVTAQIDTAKAFAAAVSGILTKPLDTLDNLFKPPKQLEPL